MSVTQLDRIPLKSLDLLRLTVNQQLDPRRKTALGQFMTPSGVARFMAAMFAERNGAVRLLDAGAGIGSLTAAFLDKWGTGGVSVAAYEVDSKLASYLRETLSDYGIAGLEASIISRDFIEDTVFRLKMSKKPDFTHAILNPPYKKINTGSTHRALLRAIGLETVNLYTAFLGLAIAAMVEGGEIVAIIPRSFCNGLYYKPFREWMLDRVAIERIHLFHSRTSAFNDDEVLQENIIIKLVRGSKQGNVLITTSSDITFADLTSHEYKFSDIVKDTDEQKFIHVPMGPSQGGIDGLPQAQLFWFSVNWNDEGSAIVSVS